MTFEKYLRQLRSEWYMEQFPELDRGEASILADQERYLPADNFEETDSVHYPLI